MEPHYCLDCALAKLNYSPPPQVSGLIPASGSYQYQKFEKHTTPQRTYPQNSVFHDKDYSSYQGKVQTGTVSGCVRREADGRNTLLYVTDAETGQTFRSGSMPQPCNGVLLACIDHSGHLHARPFFMPPESVPCAGNCGKMLPNPLPG